MSDKTGGPVFPIVKKRKMTWKEIAQHRAIFGKDPFPHEIEDGEEIIHEGLNLRNYFAGQALNGLCQNLIGEETGIILIPLNWVAKVSFQLADAMLKEGKNDPS